MKEKEGTLMYLEIEALLDEFYKTYYKIEEINLNQVIKCLTTTELHVIEAIGEEQWEQHLLQ